MTVGRDCRATSDPYAEAVIAGLASTGLQVYDIGICPTPLLYFSLFHLDVDGGIEVTASHNPSEYNGFKLCIGKDTLYGQQIQDVRVKMERNEFKEKAGGKVERYEILSPYQKHLLQDVPKLKRPLKVVVDAGSGVGGPVAPPLFRQLGCLVWEIACKPDGNFPIHHPDPTIPENLELLIEKVKHEKADLGIAYDGDATASARWTRRATFSLATNSWYYSRGMFSSAIQKQSSSPRLNVRSGSMTISLNTVECRSCGKPAIRYSRPK